MLGWLMGSSGDLEMVAWKKEDLIREVCRVV